MPDVSSALIFLINTLFDLYLNVLAIRLVLVYVHANYFDPITQFIIKLTDFIIRPLKRLLPNIGKIESASFVVLILFEMIKFALLVFIKFTFLASFLGLLLLATADFINIIIQIFFYAILIQVVLTWIQPYSPFNRLLYQFTNPVMRPFQKFIPLIGGIDISPIPVLIILQLLSILFVHPMLRIGMSIAINP